MSPPPLVPEMPPPSPTVPPSTSPAPTMTSLGAAKLLDAATSFTESPLTWSPGLSTRPTTGGTTSTAATSPDLAGTNSSTTWSGLTSGLGEWFTAVTQTVGSSSGGGPGRTESLPTAGGTSAETLLTHNTESLLSVGGTFTESLLTAGGTRTESLLSAGGTSTDSLLTRGGTVTESLVTGIVTTTESLLTDQLTSTPDPVTSSSSWSHLLYPDPENLTSAWTLYSNLTTATMNYINSSDIFPADGGLGAGGGGYGVGAQYRLSPAGGRYNDSLLLGGNLSGGLGADGLDLARPPAFHKGCLVFDFLIEAVFMGLLCAFGFTGNTLSMICLWRDKSKTATPFLLVSLELADTLFLVTVLLLRVLTSIHGWLEPVMSVFPYIGSYVYPCALIAETGSIYLTILVTVNRYVSVCRPYEASNLCSIYHARRHVVLVAAFSVVFNLPRFFEYRVVHVPTPGGGGANLTTPRAVMSDMAQSMTYQIVYANALYFLVMFAVPLLTLICLNYKLIKALRKTKKKRAQLISSSHVDSQSRSEDDITLVLIVVVIVFVLSQTPALITQSLFSFLTTETRVCPNAFFYYERISDLMVVANASMNFIIYCFCSTKFRQILVNLLCKKELDSPEQSENVTRVTKIRTAKCGRGAKDSMV